MTGHHESIVGRRMSKCDSVVVIGASTGGPQTLRRVIAKLPVLDACVVIVQHMPQHVNESIRKSLSRLTEMKVELAEDGMALENGLVLIAPSEVHLEFENNERVKLVEGEKVNFVCPSVDVTMRSLQKSSRIRSVGIVLTGMGSDGARGISHIKNLGGVTIAQDEESCIIYGMPRAAAETGKVDYILPPEMIGDKITELTSKSGPVLKSSGTVV